MWYFRVSMSKNLSWQSPVPYISPTVLWWDAVLCDGRGLLSLEPLVCYFLDHSVRESESSSL
jgi:hypothetical protein